jgi:hypothetical protein|tara:strand:- start:557 stop:997 length:441 start_codon:yes stop_codon:yes gene_type:complete
MAVIDYLGIENAIKDLIEADSNTSSFTVLVEPIDSVKTDACPYVAIFLDSWDSPSDDELIGGSRPLRTFLTLEIWCYDFSLENLAGAEARDDMLGKVKEVLKQNRTISDNVLVTRFLGGSFDNQKQTDGLGFFKGVSIKLQCEVRE